VISGAGFGALEATQGQMGVNGDLHPGIRVRSGIGRTRRFDPGQDADDLARSSGGFVKRSANGFHQASAAARQQMDVLVGEPSAEDEGAFLRSLTARAHDSDDRHSRRDSCSDSDGPGGVRGCGGHEEETTGIEEESVKSSVSFVAWRGSSIMGRVVPLRTREWTLCSATARFKLGFERREE